MITISISEINDKKFIKGFVGKVAYSVKFSEDLSNDIVAAEKEYNNCTEFSQAVAVMDRLLEKINLASKAPSNDLEVLLEGDLMYKPMSDTYHVVFNEKVGKEPVHKFFVDKMIEASDKGLSPKPWLIFWVRLMRNSLYRKNSSKLAILVKFLEASYVDKDKLKELIDNEGYSESIALKLATFDQISINNSGCLMPFKYVDLISDKYVVEKDDKGIQTIVIKNRYDRVLEVDDVTGAVLKDELVLPSFAEEFIFKPSIMGESGDEFTCHEVDDVVEIKKLGHVIRVGRIHSLSAGFSQVNTNDDVWGVKGFHLGGRNYVENFGGKTSYLIDCAVAPEDIGAVADLSTNRGEGAIRCRRYMVVGAHFVVNKGMYHPSTYAALLDNEWEDMKKLVIEEVNKSKQELDNIL